VTTDLVLATFSLAAGVALLSFFTLNVGSVATRVAVGHKASRGRIPRYCSIFDGWRLSERSRWWRIWGSLLGGMFAAGGLLVIASDVRP